MNLIKFGSRSSSCLMLLLGILIAVDCQDTSSITLQYTQEDFESEISKFPHFVMFFAPWCGHCQRLTATFDRLAGKYNIELKKEKVVIAKVDCTLYTALCSEQDVIAYPTLKYFWSQPHLSIKYKGKRDVTSLQLFLEQMFKFNSPTQAQEFSTEVLRSKPTPFELTDETFKSVISDGNHFVKFYAPWCSHCQAMAPVWDQLRQTFMNDNMMTVSKVDCTKYHDICREHSVRGYPTLIFFSKGKQISEYHGAREHDKMKEFVLSMIDEADANSDTVIDKIPEPNVIEEKEEFVTGEIVALDASKLSGITGILFVDFFQPWCMHCKNLQPVWEEMAKMWNTQNGVTIGSVDCSVEIQLCKDKMITKYPTLFLFKDGAMISEYSGQRDVTSLNKFILGHVKKHDEL